MSQQATWDPFADWRHVDVDWIRVNISREEILRRYTTRSDAKGLAHAMGFLGLIAATGGLSYFAFANRYWLLLALGLYVHGTFYNFFRNALHELSHRTVFASKWLGVAVTALFGWLYWPYNPHFYRLSHQKYHHKYTLFLGSDGEQVPTYVQMSRAGVIRMLTRVLQPKSLLHNLYRLFTITPTAKGWRGRGPKLDQWERFILEKAGDKERRQVYRLAVGNLIGHVAFVAVCIAVGLWFLPIIVTLAPFYGSTILSFVAGSHQHAGCDENEPDFRLSCGDAKLDPLTSFLYWRMEYHIEHHMFAAIPCYNLKAFGEFVADQLPPKEKAIPRLRWLTRHCPEKWGSAGEWRARFAHYKGV